MKKVGLLLVLLVSLTSAQQTVTVPFDLWHWKLELPTGYTASDWKLSNFQNDRFARPFFYMDASDESLVMKAYPAEGKSKAKYTRNTLRQQMQPGSNDVNWTMKEGGVLECDFQLTEISSGVNGKLDRTVLMQIDGRTTAKQTKQLGLRKPVSLPLLKVYWQDGYVKITRKVLKDEGTVGDVLLTKSAWKEDKGYHSAKRIGFDRTKIRIEAKKGKLVVYINDEKPKIFRDPSISQWYFENYFTVGNYLQTKEEGSYSTVKYFNIEAGPYSKKK